MANAKGAREVARWTANYIDQTEGNQFGLLDDGYRAGKESLGAGRDMLTGYAGTAASSLNQGAANARSDLGQVPGLWANLASGNSPYGDWAKTAQGNAQDSRGAYMGFLTGANSPSAMLENGLGLHGQTGNDAARGAFQAGPGYQWSVDQATDAAARKAASLGIAGSGNTLSAITDRASGLANQEWGGWLDRLGGYNQQRGTQLGQAYQTDLGGANTASALAGQMQGLGTQGMAQGYTNLANMETGLGNNRANLWNGLGGNLANSFGAQAQFEYANPLNKSNIIQQDKAAVIGAQNQALQASQAAQDKNTGMLMGGLNLGAQALGFGAGGGGMGGIGSFLGSMFGGGGTGTGGLY